MRFFGLKSCDTCRKALKSLAAAGHTPEVIDLRADGIPDADQQQIIAAFGADAINKASTTWRGLTDAQKAADPLDLIRTHPTLMKRPVVEQEGAWTIGWKADVQSKYLGAAGDRA